MKPNSRLLLPLALLILSCPGFFSEKTQNTESKSAASSPEKTAELTAPSKTLGDGLSRREVLLNLIYQGLSEVHYQPQEMDDDFSRKIFDLYLKRIDINKLFLTRSDYEQLLAWRDKIDDQIEATSYEFFDLVYSLQTKREAQVKAWCQELLADPLDFTVDEEVTLDGKALDYAKDEAELRERWRKTLKYWTLTRLVEQLEIQEKAQAENDTSVEQKSVEELEKDAREKARKLCNDWSDRLAKLDKEDRRAEYINAVANLYDPHTEYFPPADKENFDIAASGTLEGIGARLQEKEGYIRVAEIVPGSASALQGELEAEDIILEVAQEGKEPVNIVGAKIDDAVQMIRGPKGTRVTLTVKKPDGEIKTITITRDVVILEETYAKSAILEKDGEKIGVINLPSFYADFNGVGGRSSADDVRRELEKLRAEGVDGIILDLRGNGGGSLADAILMAGLFIESGPIVQVKGKQGSPRILTDPDASLHYEGDLVVLIDHFSASASEILAAAVQDYKRGVVIGSTSSFGKGTVQRFLELDKFVTVKPKDDPKPLGALKITEQKFYRISGSTTQLKGVVPDIILPDEYAYLDFGEKSYDHPLPWDEITPASFSPWKASFDLEKLREASLARVKKNNVFQMLDENARRLKRNKDQNTYSLKLDEYHKERKQWQEEAKRYKDILKPIKGLKVSAPSADREAIQADAKRKNRVESWHKQLEKDPYLVEAMNILKDM